MNTDLSFALVKIIMVIFLALAEWEELQKRIR